MLRNVLAPAGDGAYKMFSESNLSASCVQTDNSLGSYAHNSQCSPDPLQVMGHLSFSYLPVPVELQRTQGMNEHSVCSYRKAVGERHIMPFQRCVQQKLLQDYI